MATTDAQVTVTGTPENPVFNFVLPSGGKGDPGGLVLPVVAYSGDDANKYTTPGTVYQTSGSTLALNWPIAGKGHLLVIGAPGTVQQIFYPLIPVTATAAKVSYTRVQLTATTWSAWSAFTSQRVDNTAGRAIYTWDDTANREQLVYGDTGWREIKPSSLNTLIWSTTTLRLRRVGNVVDFTMIGASLADPALAGTDIQGFRVVAAEDIPAAFRPATNTYHMGFGRFSQTSGSATPRQYVMCVMNATGGLHFEKDEKTPGGTVLGPNSSIYTSGTYTTIAPWPTTLPGTAVGTIPNL